MNQNTVCSPDSYLDEGPQLIEILGTFHDRKSYEASGSHRAYKYLADRLDPKSNRANSASNNDPIPIGKPATSDQLRQKQKMEQGIADQQAAQVERLQRST